MKFIGCCLDGELYKDSGFIYLKPYINVDRELLDWAGEESDSHRETSESMIVVQQSEVKNHE